jgi:Glycine rich protein
MTERLVVCSIAIPVCERMNENGKGSSTVPGYRCDTGDKAVCVKCHPGEYGTDGQFCLPCPFATWSANPGSSRCESKFKYSTAGKHDIHIPWGVNRILVQLWGAGGGGDASDQLDNYQSYSGGSGGYLSCNVSVAMGEKAYVIVGGGGATGHPTLNRGG